MKAGDESRCAVERRMACERAKTAHTTSDATRGVADGCAAGAADTPAMPDSSSSSGLLVFGYPFASGALLE